MLCDICNELGQGTVVKAAEFSAAVKKGFDPFAAGLVPDVMEVMGLGNSYPDWASEAISGPASRSDWNVCSECMTQLRPYIGGV